MSAPQIEYRKGKHDNQVCSTKFFKTNLMVQIHCINIIMPFPNPIIEDFYAKILAEELYVGWKMTQTD